MSDSEPTADNEGLSDPPCSPPSILCPECHGFGGDSDDDVCEECEGFGEIEDPKFSEENDQDHPAREKTI